MRARRARRRGRRHPLRRRLRRPELLGGVRGRFRRVAGPLRLGARRLRGGPRRLRGACVWVKCINKSGGLFFEKRTKKKRPRDGPSAAARAALRASPAAAPRQQAALCGRSIAPAPVSSHIPLPVLPIYL